MSSLRLLICKKQIEEDSLLSNIEYIFVVDFLNFCHTAVRDVCVGVLSGELPVLC